MPNEVDEFLKGINEDNQNGDDIFNFKETKPEVIDKVDDEPKEDEEETKEVPFHKNPKLTKFIEKEVSKRLQDYKPEVHVQKAPIHEDTDPLLDSLYEIIGNDTPEKIAAAKRLQKALGGLKEDTKREAFNEIQAKENESRQAEIDAQNEVSSALDDIEETYNVDITSNTPQAKKSRSDFLSFVERISPKDKEGNIISYPDFSETFKIFKDMNKPASNDRAKEISAKSMANSSEPGTTSESSNSWKDVDKYFSKLFNK